MRITIFLFFLFQFIFIAGFGDVFAETYTNTFTKEDRTYIVTKTIQDGKIIIETKVYDITGQLLKTDVVEKTEKPSPIKEYVYPSKTVTKTPVNTTTQKSISPSPKPTDGIIKPTTSSSLQTDLPIEVSSQSGNLVVKLTSGDKELLTSHEAIVNKAGELGLDLIDEVKLIQGESGLQYFVRGTKKEMFLAVFEVYLPTSYIFNTDNGGLEKVEQNTLIKLADVFSF